MVPVVSLFTMVPVQELHTYISELLPADVIALFQYLLTSTYF